MVQTKRDGASNLALNLHSHPAGQEPKTAPQTGAVVVVVVVVGACVVVVVVVVGAAQTPEGPTTWPGGQRTTPGEHVPGGRQRELLLP